MLNLLVSFGTSLLIAQLVMLFFWILYLRWDNVSLVDIAWGLSFGAISIVLLIVGDGYLPRRFLLTLLILFWSTRLSYHLFKRFDKDKKDPRYVTVLEKWPFSHCKPLQVWSHYAFQGILVAFLSVPFLFISHNSLPYFSSWEVFGLVLWGIGYWGESVADQQLFLFKKDPTNEGKVCDWGLWNYSRHPNYFFESLMWIAYGMIAFAAPWGWIGLFSPVLMIYLLLQVSGIPLNEAQALSSKGDAYKEYQKKTSPFIPWFKLKG